MVKLQLCWMSVQQKFPQEKRSKSCRQTQHKDPQGNLVSARTCWYKSESRSSSFKNLPHGIGKHGKEKCGHANTSPLHTGESASDWSREDAPENVVITEHVEEPCLEQETLACWSIHRRRSHLDLRGELIPVYGKPTVSKEPELLSSL